MASLVFAASGSPANWAAEISYSPATLRHSRVVASRWLKGTREHVTSTVVA